MYMHTWHSRYNGEAIHMYVHVFILVHKYACRRLYTLFHMWDFMPVSNPQHSVV